MNYKSLYHEYIQDHYRYPRNQGKFEQPDCEVSVFNPACGDELFLSVKIDKNGEIQLKFEGKGCIISRATASIVIEYVQNKTYAEIAQVSVDDIKKLIKIELGPNRLQCALLSFDALKKMLFIIDQK